MTSTKRLSPAAKLLRQSRLMAMPAPVSPPPSYYLFNPNISPHPTVQAIATPPSSHARGNWGLKRDLPTKMKYPYLRYTKLDTLEHFTTYESAGDDVITVRKWQEMDLPIFKGPAVDFSVLSSNTLIQRETVFSFDEKCEDYKWRYDGPYLPDMPAGEFKRYVKTKIKPRRKEFIEFVAKYQKTFASRYNTANKSTSIEASGPQWYKVIEAKGPQYEEINPDKVDIHALRADAFLLEQLVLAFLDIPFHSRPHRTHPSGGLHYTRSNAHVRNNPIGGPSTDGEPVLGRFMNSNNASGTMVGVGGFIAKVADIMRLETSKLANNRQYTRKYMPVKARLDAIGRVLLDLETVNEDGSRGNYGIRGADGETMNLLKGYVPPPRAWSGLYSVGTEEPHEARVNETATRNQQKGNETDAIMSLLSRHY